MADPSWRVRKGSKLSRFMDGLVLEGGQPGMLSLKVCRAFRSPLTPSKLGALMPLAAACTSEGIRRDTGLVSWLHWPDLVTIGGRVVAMSSTTTEPSRVKTKVTFGIWVNCFADDAKPFPKQLQRSSILEVLGVEIDRELLRDKVLHALDWYCAELDRGMDRKVLDRIGPTIAWLGREVEVTTRSSETITGLARGLDEQGRLVLEAPEGGGDIRSLRPEHVALVQVK